MKLSRLIRFIEDLSKGDAIAWSLVGICTAAMGVVLYVRQKPFL